MFLKNVPAEQEVHVIVDNYCTHKKNDDWLAAHPNVTFHFTPTSAFWLNQVEIWFGIRRISSRRHPMVLDGEGKSDRGMFVSGNEPERHQIVSRPLQLAA